MATNCVYKITNLENGKIYIGSTNNFARRIREHKVFINCDPSRPGYNHPLYCSFRKRGIEKFDFSIIVDNIETLTLARQIEQEKIKEYNSLVPNGYNLKENTQGMSEKDIDHLIELTGTKCALIDENEKIIKIYRSLREAEREEKCFASSIAAVCKGKVYKTNNKLFRYLNENNEIIEIEPKYSIQYSEICGISMFDENEIIYFNSIKEAGEKMKVTPYLISKSIKGESRYTQVKGYLWRRVVKGSIIDNNINIHETIKQYNKKYILYNGERKTLTAWANSIGISLNSMKQRLAKMSFEEAMLIPAPENNRRYTGKRILGR